MGVEQDAVIGMVTPLACGVEETWKRILKGESGAKKVVYTKK